MALECVAVISCLVGFRSVPLLLLLVVVVVGWLALLLLLILDAVVLAFDGKEENENTAGFVLDEDGKFPKEKPGVLFGSFEVLVVGAEEPWFPNRLIPPKGLAPVVFAASLVIPAKLRFAFTILRFAKDSASALGIPMRTTSSS